MALGLTSRVAAEATAGSQFAAVGEAGAIVMSLDGRSWTPRSSGTSRRLRAVTAVASGFVAVGELGTILRSDTGEIWTNVTSGTMETLRGIAASPDRIVAVGGHDAAYVLTSVNGSTWSVSDHPWLPEKLRAVAWGHGIFVAVGSGGRVLTSADGLSWTVHSGGTTARLDAVYWTGAQFQAVTEYGEMLTSADGTNWTMGPRVGAPIWLEGFAWNDKGYVVVGSGGIIATNFGDHMWTGVSSGISVTLHGITWSGVRRSLSGDPAAEFATLQNVPTISMQPLETVAVKTGSTVTLRVMAEGSGLSFQWTKNGQAIAGQTGPVLTMPVQMSDDGATYAVAVANASGLCLSRTTKLIVWGLGTAGSQFVAVGEGGAIVTSPDGRSWTPRSSGTNRRLRAVTTVASGFVAVGELGTILRSDTGEIWTNVPSGTIETLRGIAASPDRVVAVGGHDSAFGLTSVDGLTWTVSDCGRVTGKLRAVAWGNGTFVAVGSGGRVLTSVDGARWREQSSGTSARIDAVYWTGMQFQAVTQYGQMLTSADGTSWAAGQSVRAPIWLEGFAWSDRDFVVVGSGGMIEVSSGGRFWAGASSGVSVALHGVTWSGAQRTPAGDLGAGLADLRNIPTISTQPPETFAIKAGGTLELSVTASGGGLVFQWMKNGQAIVGQTDPVLTMPVQMADDGSSYGVLVTNGAGSCVSRSTKLTVLAVDAAVGQFVVVGQGLAAACRGTVGGATAARAVSEGRFVAGADSRAILSSADRIGGSGAASVARKPQGGDAGSGGHVGAGGHSAGLAVVSADGAIWSPATAPVGVSGFRAVAWGNNAFAAVGVNGMLLSSVDGLSWWESDFWANTRIDTVIWTGIAFLAVTEDGQMLSSADGVIWIDDDRSVLSSGLEASVEAR